MKYRERILEQFSDKIIAEKLMYSDIFACLVYNG